MNRFLRFFRTSGRGASPRRPRASSSLGVLRRLASDDSGVALVFTVAVFLFLFVLVLSVYSVGETIRRKEELQNACDAAAQSAAAIEADALSRMAVANRIMAWHYIQMTKEQMDYIVYRFFHEVRDRFRADQQAVRRDDSFRWNASAAYYHLENNPIIEAANDSLLKWVKIFEFRTGSWWNRRYYATYLRIKCHNPYGSGGARSHADPMNPRVRFIGFGSKKHAIRLGYDDNFLIYYDDEKNPDGELYFEGDDRGILEQLEESIDIEALRDSIEGHKKAIQSLNVMYAVIWNTFLESANKTIPAVLAENLPHRPDGTADPDVLRDYRWTAILPNPTHPREYPLLDEQGNVAQDEDASRPSFFTGLLNTEEDELLFLNMADGLPGIRSNPVVLADYFADDSTRDVRLSDKIFPVAAGLDQWFIRSVAADVRDNASVSIDRAFPFLSEGGILRGYKNANYDEGSVNAFFNRDVHRGNHVFHLPQNPLGEDSPVGVGSLTGALSAFNFSFPGFIGNAVGYVWQFVSSFLGQVTGAALDSIVGSLLGGVDKLLDVDPSCRNMREYFFDTCSHVNGTYGLVAEYEWHTAEWLCAYLTAWQRQRWIPNLVLKSSTERQTPIACVHIPIPAGAAHGAPNVSPSHAYDGHSFFGFISDEIKGLLGPGHSRRDYRSTFINLSNEPFRLPHDPNTILKGYCRIYGDDINIFRRYGTNEFDEAYVGTPAQPWLVNEQYFAGAGSIVVALARRRANVFERFMESTDAPGLVSAFSATDRIPGKDVPAPFASSRDRYLVTLSAARAAPAPRIGGHRAAGDDTVNRAGSFHGQPGYSAPPTHDIAFDLAAWRNLGPSGHPELPGSPSDYRAPWTKAYLEQELRVGCPCGSHATERRLDRQWNLSQTDWEPRLIPVRYALTAPDSLDTGASSPRAKSDWGVAAEYPPPEEKYSNVPGMIRLLNGLPWHPMDDGPDEHASDVLEVGSGDSPAAWTDLMRKRKIY